MSYVPHTEAERMKMLSAIGVETVSDLFADLPEGIRLSRDLQVPAALDEHALLRHMQELAGRNRSADELLCFLGAGIYDHFVPSVVDALASRGEFATSYTPYQPELSQGMLQAIYEFQSLVCLLTGMDLANASMYDAATAIAEAALMLADGSGRSTVVVSRSVHPHYRRVLETYLRTAGYRLKTLDYQDGVLDMDVLHGHIDEDTACVVVQHPNFFGCLEDIGTLQQQVERVGARSVVSVNPISLGLLKPPGDYGVDVVVGEGQCLGNPMGFGGPLLGFFACKEEFRRRFPGRIVGATTDTEGRRGYTMTLRTREQDIRREKATSNICTNEALLALAATVHLAALGKHGLRAVAEACLQNAHYVCDSLSDLVHVEPRFRAPYFHEFVARFPLSVHVPDVLDKLLEEGILGGLALGPYYDELQDSLLICVTETKTRDDLDRYIEAVRAIVKG